LGLLCDAAWGAFTARREATRATLERLAGTLLVPDASTNDKVAALGTTPLRKPTTLLELLRRPEVPYAALQQHWALCADPAVAERVDVAVKYQGYIDRQAEEAERFRRLEDERLPDAMDYQRVPGLSREVREKLARFRPRSLG